jgi:hypothetical protein
MPGGWPVGPGAQAPPAAPVPAPAPAPGGYAWTAPAAPGTGAPAGYAWPQPAYAWPPPATDAPRAYTGYPYPVAHAAAGHPKVRLAHRGLILTLVGLIAVSVVIVVAAAASAKTSTPPSCRLVLCAQPPTGPPVVSGTVYTSSTYGFSVSYAGESGAQKTAAGVQLGFDFNGSAGTDTLAVLGQPASGQDAQAVVQSIESSQFANAVPAYTIPGAYVGYQLGYGVAFDVWSNNADGSQSKQRVLLMAAVRGSLAIVVLAFGPYLVLTPKNGFAAKPTGADLPVAAVADPIVNSITWPSS